MSTAVKPINTTKFAEHLRARSIDVTGRRILITRLATSDQEIDLTVPTNCNGYGRIHHFRQTTSPGWPSNPLPTVPACKALGIYPAPDMMRVQVFQHAACAWRCWYCFVPDNLLNASPNRSNWFTSEELIELYQNEPDRPQILDLSGGSPDLVPEWTPWMMRALTKAGLDRTTYLWVDNNLSAAFLFDNISREDKYLLQTYQNYGQVCCFKGFDPRSFSFNTHAAENDFLRQFKIMQGLLEIGIDLYGYVTLTSPYTDGIEAGVADFVDRLQELDENLPLRVVPLEIRSFTPVNARIDARPDRKRSLRIQEEAVAAWISEISRRFAPSLRSLDIASVPLTHRKRS